MASIKRTDSSRLSGQVLSPNKRPTPLYESRTFAALPDELITNIIKMAMGISDFTNICLINKYWRAQGKKMVFDSTAPYPPAIWEIWLQVYDEIGNDTPKATALNNHKGCILPGIRILILDYRYPNILSFLLPEIMPNITAITGSGICGTIAPKKDDDADEELEGSPVKKVRECLKGWPNLTHIELNANEDATALAMVMKAQNNFLPHLRSVTLGRLPGGFRDYEITSKGFKHLAAVGHRFTAVHFILDPMLSEEDIISLQQFVASCCNSKTVRFGSCNEVLARAICVKLPLKNDMELRIDREELDNNTFNLINTIFQNRFLAEGITSARII